MPKLAQPVYQMRRTCRLCSSSDLQVAFPMVAIPQGDAYVPYERRHEVETLFPHDIMFCNGCGNLQTCIDVDLSMIYDHYIWTTSSSPGLVASYEAYVADLASRFPPKANSLAVEIGANDGSFTKFLKAKGFNVLAVEPAKNLAAKTKQDGIETLCAFFNPEVADGIKKDKGTADLIVANHVFPNANDVNTITEGAKRLLSPDGVFVIQVFYLYDVLKGDLLENFNHEHCSYLYARTLKKLFESCGLELFDVQHVPAKGGSLRCFIQHKGGPHKVEPSVASFIEQEEAFGLHKVETYKLVSEAIERRRKEFRNFFDKCRAEGKKVAAYGTSIGATVFVYQYGLGEDIQFFVDDDPNRHNLVSPGHHIPVKPPQAIYDEKPDYLLIMAPLYADIIINKNKKYLEQGGHFVKFRPVFEVI